MEKKFKILIFLYFKLQVTLTPHQRALINELMTEAASAINDVVRQPQMTSTCIQTDLTVPPNTPSSTSNNTTTSFDFPDPPQESSSTSSSSSDDESENRSPMAAASRPAKKLKRRRPPSFKKHRVAPKKTISEADDEDSDIDRELAETELKLKLELLSETQPKENRSSKNNNSEDSSSSDSEDEIDDVKKWAHIGQELKMIADCFGPPDDDGSDDPNAVNPFQVTDLLGLVNLMLPISVPQSLWSALLSYAAWKIFKKFQ